MGSGILQHCRSSHMFDLFRTSHPGYSACWFRCLPLLRLDVFCGGSRPALLHTPNQHQKGRMMTLLCRLVSTQVSFLVPCGFLCAVLPWEVLAHRSCFTLNGRDLGIESMLFEDGYSIQVQLCLHWPGSFCTQVSSTGTLEVVW